MRSALLALFLWLMPGCLFAQHVIDASDLSEGRFFFVLVKSSTGSKLEMIPKANILKPSGGGTTKPAPTPSKYGLTKISLQAARSVSHNDKQKQSKTIAGVFSSAAGMIDGGRIKTKQDARKAAFSAYPILLGDGAEAWASWRTAVINRMNEIESESELTLSEVATAYREIAAGLEGAGELNVGLVKIIARVILLVLADKISPEVAAIIREIIGEVL